MATEKVRKRRRCEWTPIEEGVEVYNTCVEGEEFHLTPGLDLWPFCPYCGGRIAVVSPAVDQKL